MGSEVSILSACSTDSSPILTTGEWSLHHAQHQERGQLSVFCHEHHGQGGKIDTLAQNMRLYRHPSILHYVGWTKSQGKAYLFTEKASPLSVVRKQQAEQAVCLGLFEVGQALCFLHDRAGVAHNNIQANAIFVTPHGRWKLAGLEALSKPTQDGPERAKDIQAFGLLVTQLLVDSTSPASLVFRDFAKNQMLLPDVARLPSLAVILQRPYFQEQSYVGIVTFLKELPVQSLEDKQDFFLGLADRLREIPEGMVGLQLIPLLLSRYVLMDETARDKFLPHLLCPKCDNPPPGLEPIVSTEIFSEFLVPQIRTMFMVLDTQIRLTLLHHFPNYCSSIDLDTLEDDILPAMLLGMKDSNPLIVSATLRSLADLIPILGPEVVIGANRTKVFADGRPGKTKEKIAEVAIKPVFRDTINVESRKMSLGMAEEEPTIATKEENFECWEDWEEEDNHTSFEETDANSGFVEDPFSIQTSSTITSNVDKIIKNVEDLDIMKLDVKVSKNTKKKGDELDFFADMKPEIVKESSAMEKFEEKLKTTEVSLSEPQSVTILQSSKFAAAAEDLGEEGWGDDLEWGEEDT